MRPRIAIPMPHGTDRQYAERAIPQYERAVELCGGQAVRIPLDKSATEVRSTAASCSAVLLPGSKADVDPARFHSPRSPHTAEADPQRDTVDGLLLEDAYSHRKPILGICYGLQSLNVHRNGSLIQHIPDFLPEEVRGKINHEAGGKVAIAHSVAVEPGSRLAAIVSPDAQGWKSEIQRPLPVNSSHHQSAGVIGRGLRIVARCPDDGIVEALEGTSPDHFVLAVQWHPERSVKDDFASPAIFRALIQAAKEKN